MRAPEPCSVFHEWLKMVLSPFLNVRFIMDLFDERILAVLKDGKPRIFTQLLNEVGISHNTLRPHLEHLVAQSFVVKEKTVSNRLGRPKVQQQVSIALSDPSIEIVSLPFSRLKHLCRFEKGGYCKKSRTDAKPKTALKSQKRNKNFFTPISEQACALCFSRLCDECDACAMHLS